MRIVTFERPARRGAREVAAWAAPDPLGRAGPAREPIAPPTRGVRRLGALIQDGRDAAVVDLSRALAVDLALGDAGAPEAQAESLIPADAVVFLARGQSALAAARAAVDFVHDAQGRYDAPDLREAGVVLPRHAVRLHAPVPRPGKIVCIARNYVDPARERGDVDRPAEPVLFLKAPSAVIGPDDEIVVPAAVQEPDYEGVLAVVIGRPIHRASPAEAASAIAGYCAANDVTARDFQNRRGQHFLGKSCDTFAPLGPALVTADEIPDPHDLGIVTRLSGEVVQSARTKDVHFTVPEILSFASGLMRLEPGDVVLTGTPGGVGAARRPPRWLRDGDLVEVAIERVGRLANFVRAERPR